MKNFTVEESHNSQNDRILVPSSKDIRDEKKFIDRVQKSQHLIVWTGVSASCRTNQIFVPQGVKINSEIFKELSLELEIKGAGRKLFNNEEWIFQQDSALLTPPMLPNRGYMHKILSLFRRKSGHLQVQILTHSIILYRGYCRQELVRNLTRVWNLHRVRLLENGNECLRKSCEILLDSLDNVFPP